MVGVSVVVGMAAGGNCCKKLRIFPLADGLLRDKILSTPNNLEAQRSGSVSEAWQILAVSIPVVFGDSYLGNTGTPTLYNPPNATGRSKALTSKRMLVSYAASISGSPKALRPTHHYHPYPKSSHILSLRVL